MRHQKLTFERLRSSFNYRLILVIAGVVLVLVALLIILQPEPQYLTSEEVMSIRQNGRLRVGIRSNMPGFSAEEAGLEVELANRFASILFDDSSAAVEFISVNTDTAKACIDQGDVDVVIALMQRGQFQDYLYSNTYYSDPAVYAVLPQNRNIPLSSLTVGTVQNSVLSTRLSNILKENSAYVAEQKSYASYPDLLQALKAGKIQAALMPLAYYRRFEDAAFTLHEQTEGTIDYAMMCSSNKPALVSLFNLMLDDLTESNELQRLIEQNNLS